MLSKFQLVAGVIVLAGLALVMAGILVPVPGQSEVGNGIALQPSQGTGGSNAELPEKCKVPEGQDPEAWKEHLGHHPDQFKECLA